MKLAVIADIHSNLEALNVVLSATGDVDGYICSGDIVGYGPNPNECIEIIKKLNCSTVAGNHDKAAVDELGIEWFKKEAAEAITWTKGVLTDASREYLKNLPTYLELDDTEIVHGSLRRPLEEYISNLTEGVATIELIKKYLLFTGHLHIPLVMVKDSSGKYDGWQMNDGDIVRIDEFQKVIVNVGSVGQPRDMDNRASFGIYDTEAKTVEIKRVSYNIAAVQEKMRKEGLPDFLVERLNFGR